MRSRILVAGLLAVAGVAAGAVPATAVESGGTDISNTAIRRIVLDGRYVEDALTTTGVGNGSPFFVNMTVSIPGDAHPGDTFGFAWPENTAGSDFAFDFTDNASGAAIANCASVERRLTCTLTDFVLDHTGITGDISVMDRLDTNVKGQGNVIPLDFGVAGIDPINVVVNGPEPLYPRKMIASSGWREGVAAWEVTIPKQIVGNGTITVDQRLIGPQACPANDASIQLRAYNKPARPIRLGAVPYTVTEDGHVVVTLDSLPGNYKQYAIHMECTLTDPDALYVYYVAEITGTQVTAQGTTQLVVRDDTDIPIPRGRGRAVSTEG